VGFIVFFKWVFKKKVQVGFFFYNNPDQKCSGCSL